MQFYKEVFDKISDEKRDRILNVAIEEFATTGYNSTNINEIAKKADISVGSLYSYFGSKENLLLACVDIGVHLLQNAINEIDVEATTIDYAIDKLIMTVVNSSSKYRSVVRLYHSVTTEELSLQAKKLSESLELSTRNMYFTLIKKGMAECKIKKDIDVEATALIIDNLVMMLQYSIAVTYFNYRQEQYIDNKALERHIDAVLKTIKNMLMS